jgi:hypothetical protein
MYFLKISAEKYACLPYNFKIRLKPGGWGGDAHHFLVHVSEIAGGVEADSAPLLLLEVNVRLPLVQPDSHSVQLLLQKVLWGRTFLLTGQFHVNSYRVGTVPKIKV